MTAKSRVRRAFSPGHVTLFGYMLVADPDYVLALYPYPYPYTTEDLQTTHVVPTPRRPPVARVRLARSGDDNTSNFRRISGYVLVADPDYALALYPYAYPTHTHTIHDFPTAPPAI